MVYIPITDRTAQVAYVIINNTLLFLGSSFIAVQIIPTNQFWMYVRASPAGNQWLTLTTLPQVLSDAA